MRQPNYPRLQGQVAEVTALRRLLFASGVRDPRTRRVPDEATLFGAAGGVGFAAGLRADPDGHPRLHFALGLRAHGRSSEALQGLCTRLSLPYALKTTSDARTARSTLAAGLSMGDAVLVYVAPRMLPWTEPLVAPPSPHPVVVLGVDEGPAMDEDRLWVADRAEPAATLTRLELAQAREAMSRGRHMSATITRPFGDLDTDGGMIAGLRRCSERMLEPHRQGLGVAGMLRLAEAMVATDGDDAWATALGGNRALYRALRRLTATVLLGDAGPSGGRRLFAASLRAAAARTGRRALLDLAERYEALAAGWDALGEVALPDASPLLSETRHLLRQQASFTLEQGPSATEGLTATRDRLALLDDEVRETRALAPLRQDLLDQLHRKLREVARAEEDACRTLRAVIL